MIKIPNISEKFDYLKFLEESVNNIRDFKLYLEKIEDDIKKGILKSSDLNFLSIFKKIQFLVDEGNLWESSNNLESATELFTQKIIDIQSYIRRFEVDDLIKDFITNFASDESTLSNILLNCWIPPFLIQGNINPFLIESYEKLVGRDYKRVKFIFEEPLKIESSIDFSLDFSTDTFEKSLNEFHVSLVNKLPCKLVDLFKEAQNEEQIYEWFKYCLHLIQKKKITYDRNLEMIKGELLDERS